MLTQQASTTHGFIVCNQSGERVASAEHVEEAVALMRILPSGYEVVRANDGAVLAKKLHVRPWVVLRGAA